MNPNKYKQCIPETKTRRKANIITPFSMCTINQATRYSRDDRAIIDK